MKMTNPAIPSLLNQGEASLTAYCSAEEMIEFACADLRLPPVEREHVSIQSCTFTKCAFGAGMLRNCHFSDVIFRNCDLSNMNLQGCSFHRVHLLDCRLTGADLSEGTFRHLLLRRCKADYSNFSTGKLSCVLFQESDLRSCGFDGCKLEQVEFEGCNLAQSEFHRTALRGVNFASSDITNIRISEVNGNELKGAVVSMSQALELAHLLGIKITD